MDNNKELSLEEKQAKAYKVLKGFDFKLLKEQRRDLLIMQSSEILPIKYNETIEGLMNGLSELADFAVDVLGQVESDVLMVSPKDVDEEKWEKEDGEKFDADKNKFTDEVKTNLQNDNQAIKLLRAILCECGNESEYDEQIYDYLKERNKLPENYVPYWM